MAMASFPSALSLPKPPPPALSSIRFLTNSLQFMVPNRLSLRTLEMKESNLTIRMGGGPRTYPGGVSKWQWKRMQAKKAKQLLKARLCRERQIYEMRKRTELKAAISELERPWEVVEKAPNLFSVKADEQLKVLADRFQKPGGFDMWSERDGPQILRPYDGLPSARFFPKGVVHSVKPYGVVADTLEESSSTLDDSSDEGELQFDDWIARGRGGTRRMRRSSGHAEGIRQTGGLIRRTVSGESSSAVRGDSGVLRTHNFDKHDETEDRKSLFHRGKTGRRTPNSNLMSSGHPGLANNEANSARRKKVLEKNGYKESHRRSTMNSSHGRSRRDHDRRYSHENSNGSNVDTMTGSRVGRMKMKNDGRENAAGRGFIAGSRFLQDKNSQGNDVSRRRTFSWSEDDNFGNKMNNDGWENAAGLGFIAGSRLLQDKNSQGNDVSRRRIFSWAEDDNFGNDQ